jgi:hypothetical protein
MASRKSRPPAHGGLEFKLRLPPDIATRIRAKAEREGRPQNRIIINELAEYPALNEVGTHAEHNREMEIILARYGARISAYDISESLLTAVDAVLKADGPVALESAVERLRVARLGMLALADQMGRKPKTGG